MRIKKVGTITLAITLITLGLSFLANNFIDLDMMQVLSILWPSVIILLGIEIIITNLMIDSGKQDARLKMDGLSVTLLIFIIIVSFAVSSIEIFIDNVDIFPNFIGRYKYESQFQKNITIDAKGKDKFFIGNEFGDVEISEGETENIMVEVKTTIRNNDEKYAKLVFDNLVKVSRSQKSIIEIVTESDKYLQNKSKVKSIEVNYKIVVPKGFEVDIKNSFGDVITQKISKTVKIENRHGEIFAEQIGGNLNIENSFGGIKIHEVEGAVNILNRHGDVTVKRIKGELNINNPFGKVEVEEVDDNVKIQNSHNGVEVSKANGNLIVDSEYCNIIASDILGNIEAKGSHGLITLENIEGRVDVTNEFGEINVRNVGKSVTLSTRNDSIHFKNEELVKYDVSIENEHGNIVVMLPQEQKGTFELLAEHGSIYSEIGLTVRGELNEQSVKESIGDNGPKFYLRNRHGNIDIKVN